MNTEIWKPVKGYEEYAEISNMGQIHYYGTGRGRYPDERWVYGCESGDYLNASIGGVCKGVHVWVYETFYNCDVPKGLQVNHIDENKHNNRLDNLNLMTPKENSNWGTHGAKIAASRRGKHYPKLSAAQTNHPKKSKAVQALNPKTLEIVMEFPSIIEAQRQGFNAGHISDCCRGKHKTHHGFLWQFKK